MERVSAPCEGLCGSEGSAPLRISSLTGLVKTRGKYGINEAGCKNRVVLLQFRVLKHRGRAREHI